MAAVVAALALAGCAGPDPAVEPAGPREWPVAYGPQVPPAAPGVGPAVPPVQPRPGGEAVRFGLDVESLPLQVEAGLSPDYATLWIGVWNLEQGWLVPDAQLAALRAANITPAIHFYYWGDDIAASCFDAGCNGKTLAGWDRLADELAQHLQSTLGGGPALVVLETEFNKGSVARHEPLDALLAEKAESLRTAYPAARIVLGFGDWNLPAWGTWDRAVAASDAVGLQALTGSGRGPGAGGEPALFEATLAGVQHLRGLFGKPVVLQDVAVPSAPHPATAATQAEALAPFAGRLGELKAAGVEAILYRSFVDNPMVPLDRYYGEAERHFGLAEVGTGELKPAGAAWAGAIHLERGEGPPSAS